MIIVSGLHRDTAEVRTQSFQPGREGDARKFRGHLRALGYDTVFVNEVKEAYKRIREADGARALAEIRKDEPFAFEGIAGYQLHSLGTGSGLNKGKHIASADSYTGATIIAEDKVESWSGSHKGVVVYKAVALVRKVTTPTTEIVELA